MGCWLAWALIAGLVPEEARIFAGLIYLAGSISYFVATDTQLSEGNSAGGSTWLYFGAFFMVGSGLSNLAIYFSAIFGWTLDMRILGYEWIILALVLFLTTPMFAKAPLAAFVSIIAADIGLLLVALIFWGVSFPDLILIDAWAFFVAGLFGWWMAAHSILQSAGMRGLPVGKPTSKS